MGLILPKRKRFKNIKLCNAAKRITAIILLIALELFLNLNISKAEDSKLDTVRLVLEKSGAKQQISEIPQVVQALLPAQMAAYNVSNSSRINEFILSNLASYYSTDEILKRVEKHFLKNYNKRHFDAIMKWYKSELAEKIVEMEVAASTPEAANKILSYSMQMQFNPPDEERRRMIEKLIEILELDKRVSARVEAIFTRMMKGVNSSLPEDRRIKGEELEIIKKSILGSISGQMRSFLLATYLYTYQGLSIEELGKYIDFLGQESAKWFDRNIFDAILSVIEDSSERFGVDLGKEVAKIEPEKKQQRVWKEYSVKDTVFSIDFPGEPEYETQNIQTNEGILELKMLKVGFKKAAYMFIWTEDHPVLVQKRVAPKEFLTSAMRGSVASVSGQIIENNHIDIQGYPGIDYLVAFMSGQAMMRVRIVIVEGDLVQIMINGLVIDVVDNENDRFFNSFKLRK